MEFPGHFSASIRRMREAAVSLKGPVEGISPRAGVERAAEEDVLHQGGNVKVVPISSLKEKE